MATEELDQALHHWTMVLEQAGMDWSTPRSPAEVIAVVTCHLEKLVGGLHAMREGGGPLNLPPNSEAGVDLIGAIAVTELFRDLRNSACSA